MEQEPELPKPSLRPPDLSGPPGLSEPVLSQPPSFRPPDLSGPSLRPPDLTPPPNVIPPVSIAAPASAPAPDLAPSTPPPSFAPPTIPIPEEAQKKPRVVEPDEDEIKVGDIPTFNTRVIAAAIDFIVAFGLNIAAMWILPAMLDRLGLLLGMAYLATRDSLPFLDGQSIGKKAMKIKAVTLDGGALTGNWKTGLIRNIPLLIPFFGLVELIILLTREDKPQQGKRLGDEWAKTKVIFIGDGVPPEIE